MLDHLVSKGDSKARQSEPTMSSDCIAETKIIHALLLQAGELLLLNATQAERKVVVR